MMKLDHWESEDVDALTRFYGTCDKWSWEGISKKNGTDKEREIARWIEDLAPPQANPVLLPIVKPHTRYCTWFAVAFSARQCEELRELLQAFIGQAGSTFSGYRPGGCQVDDPVSGAVRDWCGGNFFFEFHPLDDSVAEVRAALVRLNHLLVRRPARTHMALRTTEALLSEYHAALLHGEETGARRWIARLKESGRLSAQNLLFLHYDCLASFGRWQEMTEDPQWHHAVHLHRPRRITFGMLRALWYRYLVGSVDGPVGNAVEKMRFVLAEYRPLFKSALGSRDPEVLAMFALAAAADLPPRHAQLAKTLNAFPDSEAAEKLREFAEAVAGTIAPKTERESESATDPFEQVSDALRRYDPETAWGILTGDLDDSLKNSPGWIFHLLHCAREIESLEAARLVEKELRSRGGADEVLRNGTQRDHWARVQEILEQDEQPGDWEAWFERLDDRRIALEIAGEATERWDLNDYRNNPGCIQRIAKKIANTCEPGTVKMAAPHLAEFFMPNRAGSSEFQKIYRNLLSLIVLRNGDPTDGDWGTTEIVANAVIHSDPSLEHYSATLEELTVFWSERGQVARFDWALDLLDSMILGPPRAPDLVELFFKDILADFHKHARRINLANRDLFQVLCEDLGKTPEFEAIQFPELDQEAVAPAPEIGGDLSTKKIAIYTLDESPARRAKADLEAKFPGIVVGINHDHGGSEKLDSLARNADYFVVVTWAAKHAATDFIRARRSDLIYPPGRGSASIVRALLEGV